MGDFPPCSTHCTNTHLLTDSMETNPNIMTNYGGGVTSFAVTNLFRTDLYVAPARREGGGLSISLRRKGGENYSSLSQERERLTDGGVG